MNRISKLFWVAVLALCSTHAFAAVVPGNEVPDVKLSNNVELIHSTRTISASRTFTSTASFTAQNLTIHGVVISSGLKVNEGEVDLAGASQALLPANTLIGGSPIPSVTNMMTTDTNQNITGAKTFGNETVFQNTVSISSNVTLSSHVYITGTQTVSGPQTVRSSATFFFNDIALYGVDISSGLIVRNGFLNAGSAERATLPNDTTIGGNLVATANNVVTLSGNQTISDNKTLTGLTTLAGVALSSVTAIAEPEMEIPNTARLLVGPTIDSTIEKIIMAGAVAGQTLIVQTGNGADCTGLTSTVAGQGQCLEISPSPGSSTADVIRFNAGSGNSLYLDAPDTLTLRYNGNNWDVVAFNDN